MAGHKQYVAWQQRTDVWHKEQVRTRAKATKNRSTGEKQ
jgi:hypothetical protein